MAQLSHTLDEVFRRDRGRVVAQLVRFLGSIDAAEEAFQEAVLSALATWPERGVPDSPGAWLMTAAKNHALDARRHRRVADAKAPVFLWAENPMSNPETFESVGDDQLRLIFTCCHPALPPESQVALTLKLIAGFSTEEIARAFVSPETTIAQRIVRAKRTIDDKQLPYEVPGRAELPERVASVLSVVYLVFNEGHTSRAGALMRLDLQREALRLARLLCDLLPDEPQVFALLALIAFGCARAATRTDSRGELVLLSEQDRKRWDRSLIKDGLVALERARRIGPRASFVLQAEIAACHAIARAWDETDWAAILDAYDALYALDPSPVVALNRAVALCMHEGPAAALAALAELEEPLSRYHHFYATRADFRRRLGLDATDDYQRALALAENDGERRFLERKLAER
ncbi:MAG: polymerase sigma-70 factor [Myxococcales bacterium]|nr:polymerase sigma-70 factor [Myxococcales bacterium]